MHSLQYLMGNKIEKCTLNFKTFISILEADVRTYRCNNGLKTLYESDGGVYIQQMLKTKECNFRELEVIQGAL